MKRREKVLRIQQILDEHFPKPPIPLQHEDPFTLLVAVLLSAQCTDERVNKVTPALFARAGTAEAMRRLSATQIRAFIRPCGLSPQKSKAIRALSQLLVEQHDGEVPRDLEALERLPGVGHKTASVVMAQAFGVPAFPVDTHIHRLAWRWGLSSGKSVAQTERDLVRAFPRERWNTLHLQLIHFGRTFCPAVKHVVAACPLCCWAMSKARQAAEVRRRARSPART
ncbi:MAG: endonuclease III [Planctomycetota bacterium]